MKKRVTPEWIHDLAPNEVFVFGSNLGGMHGGGAARIAYRCFGAKMGVGVGLQGQSYAIPTMQGGPETIRPYVDEFIDFARQHPETTFLVTPIGCGIAGFTPADIAPLFQDAVEVENDKNVLFRSRYVVNAAGLHADEISRLMGDDSFSISGRKGEYMLLDRAASGFVQRVIFQAPSRLGKGVLVSPTVDENGNPIDPDTGLPVTPDGGTTDPGTGGTTDPGSGTTDPGTGTTPDGGTDPGTGGGTTGPDTGEGTTGTGTDGTTDPGTGTSGTPDGGTPDAGGGTTDSGTGDSQTSGTGDGGGDAAAEEAPDDGFIIVS